MLGSDVAPTCRSAGIHVQGYRLSQTIRKRIEGHSGWGKTVGRIRQTVFRGLRRVDQHFKRTMIASNIMRMARILYAVSQGAPQ